MPELLPELSIELLTDWHIGSGTGRPGEVDRLIRRDANDFPYLPAKTITGILRDACEQAAHCLDEGTTGTWHQWVDVLFGTQPAGRNQNSEDKPRPALISIQSAELPRSLRGALNNKPLLKAALTFNKPGIKIDRRSGYVEPDCLLIQEMARGGVRLTAAYSLHNTLLENEEAAEIVRSLLAIGAALVERLGAKRRRGAGRCKIHLKDYSLERAIQFLEKHPQIAAPDTLLNPQQSQEPQEQPLTLSQSNTWHRLKLRLTAQQPLILHQRTVGNVVETLDYIPGSYLLPIVAQQLRELGMNVTAAIAQESLILTPATLEIQAPATVKIQDETAGKPVPLALATQKLDASQIYNRLESVEDKPQIKPCRTGYVGDVLESLPPETPHSRVETHNTIEDSKQRPTAEVGGVYSYEAIPAGTHFRAELRLQDQLWQQLESVRLRRDGQPWWRGLEQSYSLGRARKDEYGQVLVEVVGQPEEIGVDRSRPNSISKTIDHRPTATLTVWLLSDVLLRDGRLCPTTDPEDLMQQLSQALNIQLTRIESGSIDLPIDRSDPSRHLDNVFARQRRTDSWQTRWGLPRPSLVGLRAGSCFRFKINGELPAPKALTQLEITGIGERRVEGYGQLVFNHPLLDFEQKTVSKAEPSSPEPLADTPSSSPEFDDYTFTLEKAAWRTAIRRAALAASAKSQNIQSQNILRIEINEKQKTCKPSLSQLGMLRSQIKQLRNSQTSVTDWLKHLEDEQKWTEKSIDQVRQLINEPECVWQKLNFQEHLQLSTEDLTLTPARISILKQTLWAEAVQTLVDACIRAHKRKMEKLQPPQTQSTTEANS